tara:strand:- start:1655 stop:2287 length:633 start_codon:yes stop_codon:yes gene_type:complete
LIRNEIVYSNDFEQNNLNNLDGGIITFFENTNILGNFNNDGFTLHIPDIGDHDYAYVSFDLYIHGTWDGNTNGFKDNDQPDFWIMEFKPEMNNFRDPNNSIYKTTFSNSPCYPNYCKRQSYPEAYPFDSNPKKGAIRSIKTKICPNNFFGGETSLYKIEKGFNSSGEAIIIRFSDKLYQPNAIDNNGINQAKCDESWSIDNLNVRVIKHQ